MPGLDASKERVDDKRYRLENAFRGAFLYGNQKEIDYLNNLDTSDAEVRKAAQQIKMSGIFDKNELAALRNTNYAGIFPQGGASGNLWNVIQASPEQNLGKWTTDAREDGGFFQAMHRQFGDDAKYPYANPNEAAHNFPSNYGQETTSTVTATSTPTATQESTPQPPPGTAGPPLPGAGDSLDAGGTTSDSSATRKPNPLSTYANRGNANSPNSGQFSNRGAGNVPNGDGTSNVRRLPAVEGLNNPDLEHLINAFTNYYGPAEAANFFGSIGLDVNAPSFDQLSDREDEVAARDQTNTLALQDDQQTFQEGLQSADIEARRDIANIGAGQNVRNVYSATRRSDGSYAFGLDPNDIREADIQRAHDQRLTGLNTGNFVAQEGSVADRRLSNELDAANLQAGNFAPVEGSLAGMTLDNQLRQAGAAGREGFAYDAETGRIGRTGEADVTDRDLDRQNQLDIANRQAEAQEYGANTAAGRYGRKGVSIDDNGRITIDPSEIQESDLNRITQTLVAEIQAGVQARTGATRDAEGNIVQTGAVTETDLNRQHEQQLAAIQAGLVDRAQGSEAQAERDVREQIANIQAGYVGFLDDSEREADRDLQRDLAGSQATNPFGYAQSQASRTDGRQGVANSALQRAFALQSTGGVADSARGANQFLTDQARIQSSGGLSSPDQIAHLQTLANVNNPYAYQYQADYLASQSQPGADAGARQAGDTFGQVGGNQARQAFPGGSTPTDDAQAGSLEQLRQLQLAVNAPQIRQQNIDLLSNPQALGAYVGLGNQLGDPAALQEQIALFNNPNIMTDGQRLITKSNLSGFNQQTQDQQGFQFGLAASQGFGPDQLYRGLEQNTVNSRQNQQTSRFQTV